MFSETFGKVKQILSEQSGKLIEVIGLHCTTESLGLDSMDMVELALSIEEEFDIKISDEDGDKVKTVEDLVKLVEGLRLKNFMCITVPLLIAGSPTGQGNFYTKECLEKMANEKPETYIFKHESNTLFMHAEIAPEFIEGRMTGISFVRKSAVNVSGSKMGFAELREEYGTDANVIAALQKQLAIGDALSEVRLISYRQLEAELIALRQEVQRYGEANEDLKTRIRLAQKIIFAEGDSSADVTKYRETYMDLPSEKGSES